MKRSYLFGIFAMLMIVFASFTGIASITSENDTKVEVSKIVKQDVAINQDIELKFIVPYGFVLSDVQSVSFLKATDKALPVIVKREVIRGKIYAPN